MDIYLYGASLLLFIRSLVFCKYKAEIQLEFYVLETIVIIIIWPIPIIIMVFAGLAFLVLLIFCSITNRP
jgi:hypothetical protein